LYLHYDHRRIPSNENICKYFGSYHTESEGILVLEQAKIDSWDYLLQQAATRSVQPAFWIARLLEAAKGLKVLHDQDLLYRDLHLGNILLFSGNPQENNAATVLISIA
jgi:serine/threonine protein kinase